ncbi:MAG TPA: hypothetical protein VEA44_05185 [Caulobacter sp.]|nr:hypothetical protein [Caulobacter sp.]
MTLLSTLTAAALLLAASGPVSVSVETGGDDALTQRLAEEVRAIFAETPGYSADASPRLTVLIPTHVDWRETGGRIRVSYRAELTAGVRTLRRTGSCWEDEMRVCAGQIVKAAKTMKPH